MSARNRRTQAHHRVVKAFLNHIELEADHVRHNFKALVATLPEAEQVAIANATAEKLKALAKTKTLDELIDMGVNHAIDRAADEVPREPISRERIDEIMQRAKEE